MSDRLILLDAGGVLFRSDTSARVAAEIARQAGTSARAEYSFFKRILRDPVWEGARDETWLWTRWWQEAGLSDQDQQFWEEFAREQIRPLPNAEAALIEIAGRSPIWLLSNQCIWLRDHLDSSPLTRYLDQVFISSEIGIRKPLPQAFGYVLERRPGLPEEILFIDDKSTNLQAAQEAGMNVFQSNENVDEWLDEAKSFIHRGVEG